ncbi:hypothetical protein CHARACLAT_033283 [Characodon lateralis]|uniref:Uncharacterized protein n=1 Tax=Characodon lateralis TaxID=208331 RepID=A0ABU7D3E4_9TELE|nr:hypothetical protein [Characodon lateralis]
MRRTIRERMHGTQQHPQVTIIAMNVAIEIIKDIVKPFQCPNMPVIHSNLYMSGWASTYPCTPLRDPSFRKVHFPHINSWSCLQRIGWTRRHWHTNTHYTPARHSDSSHTSWHHTGQTKKW